MRFFPIKILPIALFSILLTSCDEEKILYKAKSPEEIPPVPGLEEFSDPNSELPPGHAPVAGNSVNAGTAGVSLRPEIVTYDVESIEIETTEREIEGLLLPIPNDWDLQSGERPMRAATYTVPSSSGGSDGEFVAFYFGQGQGGSAASNIQRWVGQFSPIGGGTSPVVELTAGGNAELLITRVTLEGSWSGGMSEKPADANAVWGMDAVVIEGGPKGSLFLRLTGPNDLVKKYSDAMAYIASQVKPVSDESAATASPEASPSVDTDSDLELSLVEAPGVRFAIPASWREVPSQSRMRALQFALPGIDKHAEGELVVFYFGPGGGGSVEDNFTRWIGQVKDQKADPIREHTDVNGLHVDSVYVEGTYAPTAMGPMAPAPEPQPDQALFGIIVDGGPQGPLYIRITGPIHTVKSHTAGTAVLLKSLEPIE